MGAVGLYSLEARSDSEQTTWTHLQACVSVCVCVSVCMCARAFGGACVRACVCVCVPLTIPLFLVP